MARTNANDGISFASDVVRKAKSRTYTKRIRGEYGSLHMVTQVRSNDAREGRNWGIRVVLADIESGVVTVGVAHLGDVIKASTKFQGQPLGDLPVVLAVEGELMSTTVSHRVRRELIIGCETTHEKIRQRVSGRLPSPISRLCVALIIVEAGLYVSGQLKINPELQGVSSLNRREVISDIDNPLVRIQFWVKTSRRNYV